MKLERAHEYVTTTVAIMVGIFLAYLFGKLAGSGRFGSVTVLLGILAFGALLLALREHVWILIPVSLQFGGRVEEIPGHPALKDVVILLVFAGIFALRAFKILRRKPRYEILDLWLLVMLLYLLTVYIRNPVGGDALGSARVGGRPYLNIFVASLGFLVLARVALPAGLAKRAFYVTAGLGLVASLATIAQTFLPWTVPVLGRLYGESGEDISQSGAQDPESVGRKTYLLGLGQSMATMMIAAYPPLTLLNPVRFVRSGIFLVGVVCTLYSGFRSGLASTIALFFLATYLQSGSGKIIRLFIPGVIGIVMLTLMQGTIIELPLSIQRTLSFLPGEWNHTALADAKFSSEWRFFMWEQMLKTDRYIENKLLGDGFGLSTMQLQQAQNNYSLDDPAALQETFMISGTVHSGPVGTIKFVGYVGLGIFLCLMIALARYAWQICRDTEGTPFHSYALFVALPLIYLPFSFVFVFGAYDDDMPRCLLGAGLLKMLRTSVQLYRAEEEEQRPTLVSGLDPLEGSRPVPAHLQF